MGSNTCSWLSENRLVVGIVVAVVCVVALALGLGLGLGLSSDSTPAPTVQPTPVAETTCRSQVPYNPASRRFKKSRAAPVIECSSVTRAECSKSPLIILSLDGFRAEYLLRNYTPTLQAMIKCGVHAPYMRAMFPTKTFTNHYTVVTGLYPESHGIISNNFYDPVYKEVFNMGGRNNSDNRWWLGEPIWNTAKKAGKKVATMFWPGSDVNIQNMRPDICYNYNGSVPLEDRVAEVISFFEPPSSDDPDLVHMYFEQPDSTGHYEGPLGDNVESTLAYVDNLIGQLISGLTEQLGNNCFNLVVLGDHGMSVTDRCKRVIDLSKYITIDNYTIYEGVHVRLSSKYKVYSNTNVSTVNNPVPVTDTLSQLACKSYSNTKDWYMRAMLKQDLPKRYHYSNNRCIDDIVVDVSDEYFVAKNQSALNKYNCIGGDHGYDNAYKSMHAILVGYGPAFKQNVELDAFENIEVHNLFADILGITPASTNGTAGRLHDALVEPPSVTEQLVQLSPVEFSSDCQYPPTTHDRDERRNSSNCVCSNTDWQKLTSLTVEEADSRLNLSTSDSESAVKRHLPFGSPQSTADSDVCQLVQTDYIGGFSNTFGLPLWTAFTITPGAVSTFDEGGIRFDKAIESCARVDVRLSQPNHCSNFENITAEIVSTFLYPPGLSDNTSHTDAYISTNIVPMYTNFKQGVWRDAMALLEEYGEKFKNIQVLAGPIFDYNADGFADSLSDIQRFVDVNQTIPLPTHYYVVASYCNKTDAAICNTSTVVMSLVLAHQPSSINCWASLTSLSEQGFVYLKENTARVHDIELLTGLSLFTAMTSSSRVKLITFLSEDLWPRMSWMDVGADNEGHCPAINVSPSCPAGYANRPPPLILVSLDGFRPDYLERGLTPTLQRLFDCGVTAPFMKSIYPSLTFPNHHTISTGLYPESHGIIDNNMYDTNLNESFYLGSPSSIKPEWWQGEPIWNTVIKNNKSAMTYFWPGSDVEINGMRPTDYRNYSSSHPYSLRVDTALQWLNGSVKSAPLPSLIILYFSKVDEAGHEGGPHSLEVNEALEAVDDAMLQLMDGIYRLHLHTCVNMIVLSDHGMSDMSCNRSVLIGEFLPPEVMNQIYVYTGAAGRISNKYVYINSTYRELEPSEQVPINNITGPLSCVSPNLIVYDKKFLPEQYHYVSNNRIDDVLLLMDDTYLMDRYTPWCTIDGMHGWDARFETMKALFIGYGPSFKQRSTVEPFENIELYNLMTYLVNVSSAENNGTTGSLNHLLTSPPQFAETIDDQYEHPQYPLNEDEYETRVNASVTGCYCSQNAEYDDRLNFTYSEQLELEYFHIPHGPPSFDNAVPTLFQLYHSDFVSAYNNVTFMPQWVAANITSWTQVKDVAEASVNCSRIDVRFNSSLSQPTCDMYQDISGIVPTYLFPTQWSQDNISSTETQLLTNVVPMTTPFRTVIWSQVLSYVHNVSLQYAQYADQQLHVVMGPVFDYNSDGIKDTNLTWARLPVNSAVIPIPSHYFVILLKCSNSDNCTNYIYDTLVFILPQWYTPDTTNCLSVEQYLYQNMARVRDVELLTGLQFFTKYTDQQQHAAQTRVKIPPDSLW